MEAVVDAYAHLVEWADARGLGDAQWLGYQWDEPELVALKALLESVREAGRRVADDELVESEVILPAEESTAEEVRAMLTDEGLIPD